MPEEFEGDLAGSVFWGADLNGSTFRDVDLTGARISHAFVVDVEIDAIVDRLVVNGVDVTGYVNERDPWHPLRGMLRAATPAAMRETQAAIDAAWATTIARAEALPEAARQEQVAGEFSFVETLRHLVFAIDKWFTVPVAGGGFHPAGLPNRGSVDFGWPGLDAALAPSYDEAAAAWAGRVDRFREYLATLDDGDLDRSYDVLENGASPLRDCIFTVFEESFWHNRYALRDLAVLEAGSPAG
jgi:hypothetical protein